MNTRYVLPAIAAVTLAAPGIVTAQPSAGGAAGIFAGASDVGKTRPGATVYDPSGKVYRVSGGGADMWGAADAFHFAWVRLSGDAAVTADVHFPAGALAPLEKAVLIFRQSLDPASAYADVAIHADGHITLQFRSVAGGQTEDVTAAGRGPTRLRIERAGNRFTGYITDAEGRTVAFANAAIAMDGPVYAGIGVCAHDAEGLATVTFSDVAIEHSAGAPAR